jgi:hypothetical protein
VDSAIALQVNSAWVSIGQVTQVVVAGVILLTVGAIARILGGKANKLDVDEEFKQLRLDNKAQADESLRQYRELKTDVERLSEKVVTLDKNSLTKMDLVEMKGDIKELVKGVADSVKLIDGMPERLVSLENTRNKQSER